MIVLLVVTLMFQEAPVAKSPAQWLGEAGSKLAAGEAAGALHAVRKAMEGGLPRPVTLVPEIRALVALGRDDEAAALLGSLPGTAGGVVAAIRSDAALAGFRERRDVHAALERLTPCNTPKHREFDFWVGEWTVTDASGTRPLGTSRVVRRHGGCALVEEWTAASGQTGSSLNLFDDRSGSWHQFWVDASGTNWLSWDEQGNPATIRGGLQDGEMVMTAAGGTTPMQRGRWRLMEDGRVRQIFETSSDEGRSWQIGFEGYYTKTPEAGD